jgi:hypothetical protein
MYNEDLRKILTCNPASMDETLIDELRDVSARIGNGQAIGERTQEIVNRAVDAFVALRCLTLRNGNANIR